MDWGVSKGIQGLYGSTNKRESAKQELGVLNMLAQQQALDRQEQEAAQLKEQAYYEQISKFADNLLAPDRDKINAKAKILSKKVRDHIRMYGGDATKFFANGGHNILGEYKSNLINSPEASGYLENKKNMELILKAQMSGHGHLINPTDLQNLTEYQKNKEGKITYTGLLNEIEMPDASLYNYGEEVSVKDILYSKYNYAKIYGNYVTTYPQAGEPTKEDLLAYVSNNYMQKGSNWQRDLYLQKEKNSHIETLAKTKADLIKSQSKTANTSSEEGPFDKNYTNQYTGQAIRLFSYLPKGMSASDFKEGYWDNFEYKNQLNNVASGKFDDFAVQYSLKHDSIFDFSNDDSSWSKKLIWDWFEEEYAPRNAKRFYNGLEGQVAKSVLDLKDDQINISDKKIIGIQPNEGWYDAMGNKLGDLSTELAYDKYKGDFEIKGIINIATVDTDNNGNPMNNIVMNVIDNGKVDEEKTGDLDKAYGSSELKHMNSIVLENKDGVRFYVPVDINQPTISNKLRVDLKDYDDIKPVVQDQYNRVKEETKAQNFTAEQEVQVNDFWNEIDGNIEYTRPMYSELLHFSRSGGYDGVRDNLVKSFYGALAQMSNPNKTTPNDMKNFVSGNEFSSTINEAQSEHNVDYTSQIRDYRINDINIINEMMKNDDDSQKDFYLLWLQNYDFLSKK